ncbi:hypothetical protein C8R47DRAFT_1135916 [Mycena vitilis]|nr:hypothetical protein C8R47DRAFT_1135901 [Mycena vitilis]KAJ6480462.1 hypothetical protein C8R47DRAFT_1135916 [Mycena vitilis]
MAALLVLLNDSAIARALALGPTLFPATWQVITPPVLRTQTRPLQPADSIILRPLSPRSAICFAIFDVLCPPCSGQNLRVLPRSGPHLPLQRRAPPMLPSSMSPGVHRLFATAALCGPSPLPVASGPPPPAGSRCLPPVPAAFYCPALVVQGPRMGILAAVCLTSFTISTSLPY